MSLLLTLHVAYHATNILWYNKLLLLLFSLHFQLYSYWYLFVFMLCLCDSISLCYISVFVFVIVIINKNPLNIYRMRNMHYLTNCSQYCWGTVEGHPKLPVLDGIYFKNRIVISNSKTGLSMAYIYGVLWKSL